MNIQSNTAYDTPRKTIRPVNPVTGPVPRLWLDLPLETQTRIAQRIARLLLQMRPNRRLAKANPHAENVG
jgi:hypothetical protein